MESSQQAGQWSSGKWEWDWGQESWDSWSGGNQGWWATAYDYWGGRNSVQQWEQSSQPAELSSLQSILQRGRTVDQMQDWELQEIVRDIDRMQQAKKAKTGGENCDLQQHITQTKMQDEAQDNTKDNVQDKAQNNTKDNVEDKAQNNTKDSLDGNKEAKSEGASNSKEHEQGSGEAATEQQGGEKKESKAERKKRLHARNMRFYRSLSSHVDACM